MELEKISFKSRIFDTGQVCPKCGEHILAAKIPFGGSAKTIAKPCSCRSATVEAEEQEAKERRKQALRIQRFQYAKIPEMFTSATLKGYRRLPGTEEAYNTVKDWLFQRKENIKSGVGIVLSGPVGCGKTHLGCAILNCILEDGYTGAFWSVSENLVMLRPGRSSAENQGDIIDKLYHSRVLLMDDLGSEKPSEWTQAELTAAFDYRYREKLPTIVTTNLLSSEVRDNCGDRLYSRLMSDRFISAVLQADDYRQRRDSKP